MEVPFPLGEMTSSPNSSYDPRMLENGGKHVSYIHGGRSIDPMQYSPQEVRNSTYNPILVKTSSRASSVSAYEHSLVICHGYQSSTHSDSGYGEGESVRQPNTPPATFVEQTKDAISHACGATQFPTSQRASQPVLQRIVYPPLQSSTSPPHIDGLRKRTPFPKSPLMNETELSSPTKIYDDLPSSEERVSEIPRDSEVVDTSDSEMGEYDESESENDGEAETCDWSGQNGDLEAMVLDVLANDLPLAARLIPILHKALYLEFQTSITRKVSPWRYGVTKCASGGVGEGNRQSTSSQEASNGSLSSNRKRQRLSGGGGGGRRNAEGREEEEDDDDEETCDRRNSKMPGESYERSLLPQQRRLACPFHKRDPAKYCVQHDASFRTCAGPGFTSIQRLKEHLRRKHSPIQCGRCFEIFPTAERALALNALEDHRRRPAECELRSSSLKEGISDAQWAQLEKKKSTRKDREMTTVEKWFEIWVILFPEVPEEFKPKTPWYDNVISGPGRSLSEESQRFCALFKSMLSLKVGEGDIRFAEGTNEEMKSRLEVLAQSAFEITTGLYELSSSTTSSSARSRALTSLLGGSYENIVSTVPRRVNNSSPTSQRVAMQNQVYLRRNANSPAESPLTANLGSERPAPSPADLYNPFNPLPIMPRQASNSITGRPGITNDHSVHDRFPVRLPNSMHPFEVQDIGGAGDQFFDFEYATPFSSGNEDPNQTLMISPAGENPHLAGMGSWDQFGPRQGYSGAQ